MMKTILTVFSMLLLSAWCKGQTVVDLSQAGTLEASISAVGTDNIQRLKIKGELNGTDIRYLRQLAGDGASVFATPIVEELDLSEADIVSGGDAYYEQALTGAPDSEERFFTEAHTLGDYMFAGCQWLREVVLPASTCRLGERCFLAATRLLAVSVPEGVERIGSQAFSGCGSLTEVQLPSSVLSVDARAFEGCSSLARVTCLSATPPAYGFKSFPSPETTSLVIREMPYLNVAQDYSEADGWGKFAITTTSAVESTALSATPAEGVKHDLQGRRLSGVPERGVYIENGQKRVVR